MMRVLWVSVSNDMRRRQWRLTLTSLVSESVAFDGFLPPAAERHHQLLLPALQLVVGTLVSFGAETQVAVRQALTFVGGQRENLLIALKDCAVNPNMPALREAHLIVTLLGIILPSISEDDIVSPFASRSVRLACRD